MNREREQGAGSTRPAVPSAATGGDGSVDQKGCASCEDVQCAGTCHGTVSRLGCRLRCCLHAGHESGNHWCKICWRFIQDPVGQFLQRSERVDDEAKETQASFVQAASDVEKKEAEEQSPTKLSTTTTQDDQVTATEHWKQRLGQLPKNEDFPSGGAADVKYTHAEE